jgi:hypothetical protein
MEYFDVLDCSGRKTGEQIGRDAAHAGGVWHGAFHCCIIYPRNGAGCALFQLRSRSKRIAPERFDVSVGGHYAAGEGPRTAGPREFQDVYLLPMAERPGGLLLQKEEVDGVLELDVEQGIRLFTGQQDTAEGRFFGPGGEEATRTVGTADFVPCLDNYYCRLLVLARRYFAGERESLAI